MNFSKKKLYRGAESTKGSRWKAKMGQKTSFVFNAKKQRVGPSAIKQVSDRSSQKQTLAPFSTL